MPATAGGGGRDAMYSYNGNSPTGHAEILWKGVALTFTPCKPQFTVRGRYSVAGSRSISKTS